MLIKCPECELQVSDKAAFCPHCGYPLKSNMPQQRTKKSNKRKRLPNGFGQISEIKNRNLRKPFRAMITIGKTDTGRPICKPLKPISYFSTYNEAYTALMEYNKNPYELEASITLRDLYKNWSEKYFNASLSESRRKSIEISWKYCSAIHNIRVQDIRIWHIKGCMEEGAINFHGKEIHPSPARKGDIKILFNLLFDYAIEYGIVDNNIARTFRMSKLEAKSLSTVKNKHITFAEEEMNKLWSHVDTIEYVDMILIQCYSGWRPQELCQLKIDNVDLTNWSFKGGMKTEAGKERIVPIHSKIQDLVKRNYDKAVSIKSESLFNIKKKTFQPLNVKQYSYAFKKIVKELNLNPNHRPHDPRKEFITNAKKYNVDEYALKYMVGHTIDDITEKIYTNREFKWLANEIEKIR